MDIFPIHLFIGKSHSGFSPLCNAISRPHKRHTDFKSHFYQSRRAFFTLATFLSPLDFADTLLKGTAHLMAQGPFYFVTISLTTVLSIIAALTNNQKYHKFYAVFFLIYITIFISVNLS